MKKITVLLVAFMALSLSSCGSDDENNSDSASLVGKWTYFQEGEIVNGIETLENYSHTTGCNNDYIEFKSNGTFDDVWYNNTATGCVSENDPGMWTKTGTMITTSYSGQTPQSGEILILNENTLKVKFADDSEGATETYVSVFKR